MALSFVIRKYHDEDREQCRALWRGLTEWHREIYEDPTIGGEHPEDRFDKHLATVGSDWLWVASQGSKVVGLVGLIFKEEQAEIEPLVVSKAYRGRGIGTKLVETVISVARKKGARFLDIKPVARNKDTIRFLYERGFRNLGHINLFIDFSSSTWKSGLEIFECNFNY